MLDPTGIFDLGNTSLIFWEVITFLILLFLLVRYVYPPIRNQIEERQAEIEDARKQAEAQRERTKREAREEGDRIIQRAREEIDRERESALREVRREVA